MAKELEKIEETVDEKEIDAEVDKHYKENTDSSIDNILRLTRSVKHNGEEISELTFDFEKLTAKDALNIEAQLNEMGDYITQGALNNSRYLLLVAAKACTIPVGLDFFEKLSIVDYQKVRNRTLFFLLGTSTSRR